MKQGYDPKTFFSAVPFSGAHETGVMGVYNKQFDAAATYINTEKSGIPQRMEAKGMIPTGQICQIWKSPEITNGPLTARTNLPADLIAAVKTAMKASAEEGSGRLQGHHLRRRTLPTAMSKSITSATSGSSRCATGCASSAARADPELS